MTTGEHPRVLWRWRGTADFSARRRFAPGSVEMTMGWGGLGIKIKVKGSGQECPLHTGWAALRTWPALSARLRASAVGAWAVEMRANSRFLARLSARFGMTNVLGDGKKAGEGRRHETPTLRCPPHAPQT